MGRPRPLMLLAVAAIVVAGCVKPEQGPPLVPAADEEPVAPGGATEETPPPPGAKGEVPPRPPSSTNATPGSSAPDAPAPAGWGPGVGTTIRAAIEQAIAQGATVTIDASPVDELAGMDVGLGEPVSYDVALRSAKLLSAAPWAEIDSQRVGFPAVAAYEGEVDGRPDQLVRLTVAPTWARGSIRIADDTHLIRIGTDGNLPPSPAKAATWQPLGPPPARFDAITWTDADDCLEAAPPYVAPMLDLGRTAAAPLEARIVLDADAEAAQQIGPDVFAWMVAVMNEMDAIYDHEVGIRFVLAGLHKHTAAGTFPKPDQNAGTSALPKLAEYWNGRADADRDVVHLFTGHESDFAQANCIGGAGEPSVAYSFTPLNWERDFVVFHTQAFAHEIGHLFSAHHHYGNHAEARLATIMIQGYTPGIQPVFGTLEKSVIRGWAEERL